MSALLSNEIYNPPTAQAPAMPAGATPVSNTAAVRTITPSNSAVGIAISGICWSYVGGTPTGGNVQVTDGSTVIFSLDIASAGPGYIPFPIPRRAMPGNTLTITLAAGGSGVSGKVDALSQWEV